MPIFEYICQDCNKTFEALIIGARRPECPFCHGHKLAQQISVFSVGGSRSAPAAASCGASPST